MLGVALIACAGAPAASQFGQPLPIVARFKAFILIGTSQPFQLTGWMSGKVLRKYCDVFRGGQLGCRWKRQ
jgi:hypothetical protein